MKEKGRDLPIRYLNPPALQDGLDWYWAAFWRLNNDRQVVASMSGYRVMGIAFTALDAFARRHRVRGDAFAVFQTLIRGLDSLYVSLRNHPGQIDLTAEVTPEDSAYVRALLSPQESASDED